ncbi:MAG: response regulator [Leptospiraceae bacterium]|nr:response regulator [Leptospiraceae bacterium]
MELFLKRKFKECHFASNGKEALQLINDGIKIDIVLTDISMPIMDGLELQKRLEEICPAIPVIAITGHTEQVYLDKMNKQNFKKIFFKPIKKSDIEEIIELLKENN